MFQNYVIGRPRILNRELFLKRVEDILDSNIYSNSGQYEILAEQEICDFLECKHAIMVSNATLGLEIVLQTLVDRFQIGGQRLKALVPSFTFIASVSSLLRLGIDPVFADIDNDYCMDFYDAQAKVKQADIILPVNLFGNLAQEDLKYLGTYQETVFDCAQSMGCFNDVEQKYSGDYGLASIFSFHSTKIFSACGEGGVITTNNDDLAEKVRELKNFGYKRNSGLREGLIVTQGATNCKIPELMCASILTQLESRESILEHYFNIHQRYKLWLGDLIKDKNCYFSNYSYVIAELDNRDRIIEQLNKSNIFPRTYFSPIHLMKPFKKYSNGPLENTERIAKRIMALPTGLTISIEDVDFICNRLLEAIKDAE